MKSKLKKIDCEVIDVTKNDSYIKQAQEFLQEMEAGEVTHGIICYRKKDGDLIYRIFNEESLTYIFGMMERVKLELIK